jgi:hypothetical protein
VKNWLWMEMVMVSFGVLSQNLSGGTGENHKRPQNVR